MGQGQADIAMQLLRDCARNGEWMCLKNLHLVTAWLPALEKVQYKLRAAAIGQNMSRVFERHTARCTTWPLEGD